MGTKNASDSPSANVNTEQLKKESNLSVAASHSTITVGRCRFIGVSSLTHRFQTPMGSCFSKYCFNQVNWCNTIRYWYNWCILRIQWERPQEQSRNRNSTEIVCHLHVHLITECAPKVFALLTLQADFEKVLWPLVRSWPPCTLKLML